MDLTESRLGKKEYWDQFYAVEIRNFSENSEDTGECWFDDSGAQDRVVDYIEQNVDGRLSVLDLGTGNGMLLFALREAGVEGEFLGIDYAKTSVEFASLIAQKHNYEDITFRQVDLLSDSEWNRGTKFDLVLDKGTLDAIALSGEPNVVYNYAKKVAPLVGKRFLITSCNFTKEELLKVFTPEFNGWSIESLPYPKFSFGGETGSTVVSLAFTKED